MKFNFTKLVNFTIRLLEERRDGNSSDCGFISIISSFLISQNYYITLIFIVHVKVTPRRCCGLKWTKGRKNVRKLSGKF